MLKLMIMVVVLTMATAAQAILSTGFEAPTFSDSGATLNGIDGSATNEGVWWATNSNPSSVKPFAATHLWGASGDGAAYLNDNDNSGGMAMRVDLGQDLTSGVVTVSFDAKRRFRGYKFGGYSGAETAWNDATVRFGTWQDHGGYIYYYDPSGAPYSGSNLPAQNLWGTWTYTLDLDAGTYDISVVEPAGTATVTGATMPGSGPIRYLLWEVYAGQAAHSYFDNLSVTVIPEPATMLILLAGLGLLRKR